MRIILASASPRRRELFAQIVSDFEVIPTEEEEVKRRGNAAEIVEQLAENKAEAVARDVTGDEDPDVAMRAIALSDAEDLLILGADTVVVDGNHILGKPKNEKDAYRMLSGLAGRVHEVTTGVCLLGACGGKTIRQSFCEKTIVEFYPMTDEEIHAYIDTGDPMDKAGAYGIQSGCGKYIKGIIGDYNNVVGLPIGRLYQEMRTLGLLV